MLFCDPCASATAAEKAPLGSLTKSVVRNDGEKNRKALRSLDFAHQRTAAKLRPKERVRYCRWAMISADQGVDVALNTYARADGTEAVRAAFKGVRACGSVWVCPVCARRISEARRRELNRLIEFGRASESVPVMLTYTTRHQAGDDLRAQLAGMKLAKQRLRQRRDWRNIKSRIVGTVTATEVTFGANGPHVHFHEIALVKAGGNAEAVGLFDGMAEKWRDCLRTVGLDADLAHGFTVRGADRAGSYVAKWGAAEEMTLTGAKRGRKGGQTPRELLAAAHDGDKRAGAIWADFVDAFRGRRQLVWSPGLKALAGIDDVEDQEAAVDETQDGQTQEVIANISAEDWRGGARNRRGEILDAAEEGGAVAVAEAVAQAVAEAPGAGWGVGRLGRLGASERRREAAEAKPESETQRLKKTAKRKPRRRSNPAQMTLLDWVLFGSRPTGEGSGKPGGAKRGAGGFPVIDAGAAGMAERVRGGAAAP